MWGWEFEMLVISVSYVGSLLQVRAYHFAVWVILGNSFIHVVCNSLQFCGVLVVL